MHARVRQVPRLGITFCGLSAKKRPGNGVDIIGHAGALEIASATGDPRRAESRIPVQQLGIILISRNNPSIWPSRFPPRQIGVRA